MNNFDSLKISFPVELLQSHSTKHFEETIKKDSSGNMKSNYLSLNPNYKQTGLNGIHIQSDKCIIQISSKLIPDLYCNMIDINNIDEYMQAVNQSGVIRFNPHSVIEKAKVFSCDVTNNIKFNNPVEALSYLHSFGFNDKYSLDIFEKESIIFERNVSSKSLRERQIIYSKYPELCRKSNKEFSRLIDKEKYKNVLRFESRFNNLSLMRNSFNIRDTGLIDILNSDEKINYNIFSRITDIPETKLDEFNNYKSLLEMKIEYRNRNIEKMLGRIQIIKLCNYDIDLIKAYFKVGSTANNSKYIREYKELIKSLLAVESGNKINEMTDYIKRKLAV